MVVTVNKEEIRKALVDKLDEIRASLKKSADDIHIEYVADELDNVVSRNNRELALTGRDRNSVMARRVMAALQRLDRGTFGECVNCEEPVSEIRIRAVPWADRCLICQEAYDRAVNEVRTNTAMDSFD